MGWGYGVTAVHIFEFDPTEFGFYNVHNKDMDNK